MKSKLLAIPVLLALLPACGGGGGSSDARIESLTVASPALGDNLLGDRAEGHLTVLLPPSYAREPDRRYPVVYFLHGFSESESQIAGWAAAADAAMRDGQEMIVVGVQGRNALGGGFYVNSPVSGRFEDWVVDEAVAAVDSRYRTLAARDFRGLCGFSMGGFGAVNLALRHPDVYAAVLAMSGGFFAEDGLADALSSWASDATFRQAYGAAFAPDPDAPYPHARIPSSANPGTDAVAALWEEGFGDWDEKLAAYAARTDQLFAIHIQWGEADSYGWIPPGSAALAGKMQDAGLPVTTRHLGYTHELPLGEVQRTLLPFFQEHLALPVF